MTRTAAATALVCPTDDKHGNLLESTTGRLMCIHQEHDGRPKTHPLGESEQTPCYFTLDEVEAAQKARIKS